MEDLAAKDGLMQLRRTEGYTSAREVGVNSRDPDSLLRLAEYLKRDERDQARDETQRAGI